MEMSKMRLSPSSPGSEKVIKTKPLYEKKTFLWEIQSIESIMTDGVQRAIFCEFEVGDMSYATPRSKWRLLLDHEEDEPAISVQRISPADKCMFYKMVVHVMKNSDEESDILSYPNQPLYYESFTPSENVSGKEHRKFTLHRQHAYGCSYMTWLKDVVVNESLLLKVQFETCESIAI